MIERPILFSTEMVQAILVDRKTMTRRVCKDQTPIKYEWANDLGIFPGKGKYTGWIKIIKELPLYLATKCPYGQVGDRLWVRETYCVESIGGEDYTWYKASHNCDGACISIKHKWKSGCFVFKKYARLRLEITSIRVERVQEISTEDAVAEGAEYMPAANLQTQRLTVSQIVFAGYWDKLNARRGYSWESNPFCWAI